MLGISGLLWFLIAFFSGLNLSKILHFFKVLPEVATMDLILLSFFVKWGWKLKLFKGWLVPFPDLNGTWEGQITTTWINLETGESPSPIKAFLTIKQTFSKMSCVLRTEEMTSYSYSEGFKLDSENQIKQLSFSYTSKPRTTVKDRSPVHEGSIVFDIIGTPAKKLKGEYWTSRKTTGEIIMAFREKKLLDEYPSEQNVNL